MEYQNKVLFWGVLSLTTIVANRFFDVFRQRYQRLYSSDLSMICILTCACHSIHASFSVFSATDKMVTLYCQLLFASASQLDLLLGLILTLTLESMACGVRGID